MRCGSRIWTSARLLGRVAEGDVARERISKGLIEGVDLPGQSVPSLVLGGGELSSNVLRKITCAVHDVVSLQVHTINTLQNRISSYATRTRRQRHPTHAAYQTH